MPKYPIILTPEQEASLRHLITCYTAPYADVQRARILLLAHQHPTWRNAEIARRVDCCVNTVKHWRQCWQQTQSVQDAPRTGTPRTFTPLQRAQIIALACSAPCPGKPCYAGRGSWPTSRVEQHIVEQIAAGTIRAWLRQDKIKPWRYHSWQRSTDPHFVDKAQPVLDLYEHAPALAAQAKRSCAVMRKPPSRPGSGSVQRKQRHPATQSTSRIGINGWVPCNCSVL